jgi:Putative prokaryotic signal transducing protein
MAVELVTIERFPFLPDAEAARDLLTDQGIRAFLSDEQTISINWLLGNAIGYIKLQVPSDQVEKAQSVLREQQEVAALRRSGHEDGDATACLACGAAIPRDRQDCPSCGWSFDDDVGSEQIDHSADDDELDGDDQPSTLDRFRHMKHAVIWFLLAPSVVLAPVALVVLVIAWIVHVLTSR